MERIVFNELYEYCMAHNLLTWRNSGFKKNESTANQLLLIVHNIYKCLADGDDVLLVFLDISKAFDKVYHDGLLHKLKTFGISGCLLRWFESYLSCRIQWVVLNGQHYEWREINAGVPQGSILGPLLFLIFIDDIVDDLNSDPFLYADDTSLFKPITTREKDVEEIDQDLKQISNWAAQWRVNFND